MPESHFHHFLRDFRITPKLLSQDEAIVVSAELQFGWLGCVRLTSSGFSSPPPPPPGHAHDNTQLPSHSYPKA